MHELKIHIEDHKERTKNDQEERLILTYLNAAWQRAKKMPNLTKILSKENIEKKMTPEEMLQEVKKINQALGGSTY